MLIIYNQNKNIAIIDVPTMGVTRYNKSHLENAILIDDQNYLRVVYKHYLILRMIY